MTNLRDLVIREPLCGRDGVLDFLGPGAQDYCDNFGDQWNRFRTLQCDYHSGKDESRRRFFSETGWVAQELRDKVLLDAGCGAGRFSEVALEAGAFVIAVDISEAAFACRTNLDRFPKERFLVLRADLFDLPLRPGEFDGVFSLGVLQHTPSPLKALARLIPFLRPGGRLAVWIYEARRRYIRWLQPRTWIRSAVSSRSNRLKLRTAKALTFIFFPAGWSLSWLGRMGERLSMFLPYAARHHLRRGSFTEQWDYCVQDTYDWYGPKYELPQTERAVMSTLAAAGMINVRRLSARGMAIIGEASWRAR